MSQKQISRSSDLRQLQDDGYSIAIKCNHLVLYDVPYVNSDGEIRCGHLVSTLEMANNVTVKPTEHIVMFTGDHPCDKDGCKLPALTLEASRPIICDDIVIMRSFSYKPRDGYQDYHAKMTFYAEMISGHAREIDPNATARRFRVIESDEPDEVFKYYDTASGRAGINAVTQKLELSKIGIVGLGGTGSYVLDFMAKTPVREIHLFDGDEFLQHNAFRSPGAASSKELGKRLKKVKYLASRYAFMRNHIYPHPMHLDETNLNLLDGMDFVFICIDASEAKRPIVDKLERDGTPFVDTGMDIVLVNDKLLGTVRTTVSTEAQRHHFAKRVSLSGGSTDNLYARNIQVAEMNALNAAHAVIRWKKFVGFYGDLENEYTSFYTLGENEIFNEDQPCKEL